MPTAVIYPADNCSDEGHDSQYTEKSLGFISIHLPIRQKIIQWVSSGSIFDTFILVMIASNSISLACVDYRVVDDTYTPTPDGSIRNSIIEKAEILFLVVFIVESILKIVAFGFFDGPRAYLKRKWDVFDFLILVMSIVSIVPGVPNVSMIRSFRVLRPLRSVSKLPGLRKIIGGLVDSLGHLSNVMLLLMFLVICFSITGVLFWNGILHARCRLTPYPVKMPDDCRNELDLCWERYIQNVTENPDTFRCVTHENDNKDWTSKTSPWLLHGGQDCIWPIDSNDQRVCSLNGNGLHSCPTIYDGLKEINRTCGSNFDRFGNPRFMNLNDPYGHPRMKHGTYIGALNWGFTNYDSFAQAFVTTLQVITLEGWTDIMYQIIDAWSFTPTVIIFCIQVVLCGYIVLNLVLAVITESLDNIEDSNDESNDSVNNISPNLKTNKGLNKRRWLGNFVDSHFHSTFIMGCIVANTIVLSLDYYGISEERANRLESANTFFTLVFVADMIICNLAQGVKTYWSDPFSCFDGIIATISLIELIAMTFFLEGSEGPSSFSVFRSLRLFRVFKMAKSWKSLQVLLETISSSLQDVGNFALLLLLFMFIYSLIGMQILSNRLHFDAHSGIPIAIGEDGYENASTPRSHFDNFFWSMITVFQVLSGENWNTIMYDGWRARGWIAVIYLLSLVVIGSFIVMNLFLAILLKKFEDSGSLVDSSTVNKIVPIDAIAEVREKGKRPSTIQILWAKIGKNNRFRKVCFRVVDSPRFDALVTMLIICNSICLAMDNPLVNPDSTQVQVLRVLDFCFTMVFICEMIVKILAYGFVLEKEAYLRSSWNVLDFVIVLVSILNLASIGPGKGLRVLRTLRVLRPLRMVNRLPELKVAVDALLLSFPSVADVAVLCIFFFLIFSSFGVNFLKGTFYHCSGENFDLLPKSKTDFLLNPYEWGLLHSEEKAWFDLDALECKSSSWGASTIPSSKEVCDCLAPGEWVMVVPQNFNNVIQGIALLFEIATTEGWVDVMYAAIDQRGIDTQPIRDSNMLWAIFFIFFLIIGAFFLLELFVGVTIDNFNKIREKTGRGLMTEAQKKWAATQSFVMKIKPERRIKRPTDKVRAWCYDFIMPSTNPCFQHFISFCILLSSAFGGAVKFGDSPEKTATIEIMNLILSAIFTIEVIVKVTALGKLYFRDGWNRFDISVVLGSNLGLLISLITGNNTEPYTSIIRLARICRLFRLIKSVKQLRTLFNTMVVSLPSIANIGTLLFLLLFIYAVVGMQLFSFIPQNEDLSEQASFRSFSSALLLLLRFSTGENWNGFMRNMIPSNDNCDPNPIFNATSPWCLKGEDYPDCTPINGCGAGFAGYLYFYSFTLLITFVALNLFVGVVLEAFEKSNEGDILSPDDLDNFTKVWAEFDPNATWQIKAIDMKYLLGKLKPPLGLGTNDMEVINDVMEDECLRNLPVTNEGKVNIVHAATQLAKRLTKLKQGEEFNELSEDHPLQKQFQTRKHLATSGNKNLNDFLMERTRKKMRILRAITRMYGTTKQT